MDCYLLVDRTGVKDLESYGRSICCSNVHWCIS